MNKISLQRRQISLGVLSALCGGASAQGFSSQDPISIVIGFVPGGSTDVAARLIAQPLAERLQRTVIVDNRPGAAGMIANNFVAKSAPNGQTFLIASATLVIGASLYKTLPYRVDEDFVPISQLLAAPCVMIARPGFPARNVPELIDYARRNPGKISYGTAGLGSGHHIAWERFGKMAKVQMTHVPYKGGAAAARDLVAGHIDVMLGTAVEVLGFLQSGRVLPLGVTTLEHSPLFPDYTPVAETVPGFEFVIWFGLFAAKGTSGETANTVSQALGAVMREEALVQKFREMGYETIGSSATQFNTFFRNELTRWPDIIKLTGIELQ